MCEVGSCCGCICLYKGSLIIGLVTIFSAIAQLSIFSLILYTTFESSPRPNSTETSFYSFSSRTSNCPFGFVPLSTRDGPSDDGLISPTGEPENINLITTATDVDFNYSISLNDSLNALRDHDCLAPPPGVLCFFVVASALYIPVGIILMVGVKMGISCLLSAWFFYSVGYNLLGLITALTDGVYAGASDISSYIVCLVTAYCIMIVDSYYEKLLRTEKAQDVMKEQSGPSLVVGRCPSLSPNSSESPTNFGTPMGKLAMPQTEYAPCPAAELLLPSDSSPKTTAPV